MKPVIPLATFIAILALDVAQTVEAATARREPNGAVRFSDENGNDRGYAWCRERGGWSSMSPPDCSYYTLQQCKAAAGPFGNYCMPNPYAARASKPPRSR